MSYTFFDITTKKETRFELKNCTITGNSVVYEAKDGKITKYRIVDGKPDKNTAEEASRIELTSYQMSFIDLLRSRDGDSTLLDKKDLKNLSPDALQSEINAIYAQKGVYEAISAKAMKREAEIKIDDNKQIGIKFEKEEGFFKKIWNGICSFFKSIVSFFYPNKEKTVANVLNPDVIPEREYTIQAGDRAISIANSIGVPLSCLRAANPGKDLDTLKIGSTIKIPEWKSVEEKNIKTPDDVAESTGFSKKYIEVLQYNEGFSEKPYWDKVRYSVGYGHSGRILGKYISDEQNKTARIVISENNIDNISLNKEDANKILAQDLLAREAEAKVLFGQNYEGAPKSVQAGIVDIVYNAGIEKGFSDDNTKKVATYLENADYVQVVKSLILYPNNKESYKRNVYRILVALEDLSLEDKNKVLNSPEIKAYFSKVKDYLKEKNLPKEIELIEKYCNDILNN